jgi:SAM-dependent methyltransferase
MEGTKITSEMEALKNRLSDTWTSGDFGRIATSYQAGAVEFVERLRLNPGARVLDVACGTGNLSIPAAAAGADLTGLDIVSGLIDQARATARARGINARFDVGDAEAMPYEDESFDVVMSMFGAMFTPRPDVAASELVRVCKPSGTIAMANWTPSGFIGQMFRLTAKHVRPPAEMPSPLLWGDQDTVRARLNEAVAELSLTPRTINFVFPFGPAEVVEHFRQFYGPTLKAFEALGDGGDALRRDLVGLWAENNQAADGTTFVSSEYLEVKATRSGNAD